MFANASDYAHNVDMVMLFIVGAAFLLLAGVTIAMLYFVFRYNKKRNPKASQIEGNTVLEIIWIVIPVLLVLVMFYFGYAVFTEEREVPPGAMNIKVLARMWSWEFAYPNGKKSDTLYLPVNQPVKLVLQTADVNHAFFLPAFRVKEDIIAGRENYMVITPKETGQFDIVCAEYCGLSHSLMYTRLYVVGREEFDRYLSSGDKYINISSPHSELSAQNARNENNAVLFDKGCIQCHSLDGEKYVGPSFLSLKNRTVIISSSDGDSEININDDYLRTSISDPNRHIVKGYTKFMMPERKYSNQELDSLVIALKYIIAEK